jgi:hypothetical protein
MSTIVAFLVVLVVILVVYRRRTTVPSERRESEISVGFSLVTIDSNLDSGLEDSIPTAIGALPLAIVQPIRIGQEEGEMAWKNYMENIQNWYGTPIHLVGILQGLQDLARLPTMESRKTKQKQLFGLLRRKRKAYPKSWSKDVSDTVNELMLLMNGTKERRFSAYNPLTGLTQVGEEKRADCKIKSEERIKQRQRKQRNRKLAPEKKKKNNFGQRLQQKGVERKAATKNMEEEEEEEAEYTANGARIWKKPKPRTNSFAGLN